MDRELSLRAYHQMALIRLFEDKAGEQYGRGKIGGFLHLYIGEEACAVGAIAALRHEDYVITHYRDHGHALAKGCSARAVMAELYGKRTGVSKGLGGSMHLFCPENRLMGGYAIVGGHIPIGTGLALGIHKLGQDLVCVVFFGDGAVNEGEFHEALNMASVWKLPVVFFCENNLYAMGTEISRTSAVTEVYRRAEAYAIPGQRVDGMDVEAVYRATREAVARARDGGGPTLLEAMTYRFKGHSMADAVSYRTRDEEAEWRPRDPIPLFRERLLADGRATEEELTAIEQDVKAEVEDAVHFAEESPEPTMEDVLSSVYAPCRACSE
ncbi:MAG: Acetoin:2,6-dichlorophenolindophenol oxidoreductase subunit alpha [bacterium ADurb.Bin429]|nr:MAG: Acetoin:2,6-dichlorophenolindophenol oxidoreductase subunit alpha [bacterium ADurb.Bin429]